MPKYPAFTLAGYGLGQTEESLEIGGFNVRAPEAIEDPALREMAIQYRDAQAQGLPTTELRRRMASRVSQLLNQRATAQLLDPTDLALWGAGGAGAGWIGSKALGWNTRRSMLVMGVLGAGLRVLKGLPAYAGAKLAAAVIGGAATAQRTPEVEAAENGVSGYWR